MKKDKEGLTQVFNLPLNDGTFGNDYWDEWCCDLDETTGIAYTFCVGPWPLFLSRKDIPE